MLGGAIMKWQSILLLGVGLVVIIAVAMVDPIAQDPLANYRQ